MLYGDVSVQRRGKEFTGDMGLLLGRHVLNFCVWLIPSLAFVSSWVGLKKDGFTPSSGRWSFP